MPHSRIAAASSGTLSSGLISNGCSFKTWEAVNTGSSFTSLVDQELPHHPVDDSCFLTLTLCWIGRLHTNPIRSRVHTPPVPSGSAVLGKHLPRICCRRRHELLLILKMLILLMEKLSLSELFLCPSWVCRQGLHLGRPVVYRRWILCAIVSSWGVFLGHQNHSAELPPPVRLVLLNPPGTTAPSWHALINRTRCSGETPPQQRKIGP